ncbi:MAG: diguanylate cyclase [Gallionella sp.]|nr:diguanylate cyclase [Gallionella sp.]MDD4958749.1 diguanylate cyclase [Gallionella sp.]
MVQLASYICQTPIAAISLVDEHRQWFKAIAGLQAKETSRDVAFCAHAILQDGIMIVPDAQQDQRFFDNPLVVNEPNIRFYAGVPLVTTQGFHLGTLCVIDRVPRVLTAAQLDAVKVLADNVMAHLDLRLSHKNIRQYVNDLQLAATIFESSSESMIITDAENRIITVNPAFTVITGYTLNEVVGRNPKLLSSGKQGKAFYQHLWHTLNSLGHWNGEVWNLRKNGEMYAEWLSINVIYNPDGSKRLHVAIFSDITEKKQAGELIWKHAHYDHLTQLPNRRLLLDKLKLALSESEQYGRAGALLFVDLDNFKTINDTLGHDTGDQLLQQVAQRLVESVRVGDMVARFGGDEFVVMLENLDDLDVDIKLVAETVGNKILFAMNQPFHFATGDYVSTPSIGIALFNGNQYTLETLLKQADLAMYDAKNAGRNTMRFFDTGIQIE